MAYSMHIRIFQFKFYTLCCSYSLKELYRKYLQLLYVPCSQLLPVHPGAHVHSSGELHVPPLRHPQSRCLNQYKSH